MATLGGERTFAYAVGCFRRDDRAPMMIIDNTELCGMDVEPIFSFMMRLIACMCLHVSTPTEI
jgi:hypothetical protein